MAFISHVGSYLCIFLPFLKIHTMKTGPYRSQVLLYSHQEGKNLTKYRSRAVVIFFRQWMLH